LGPRPEIGILQATGNVGGGGYAEPADMKGEKEYVGVIAEHTQNRKRDTKGGCKKEREGGERLHKDGSASEK